MDLEEKVRKDYNKYIAKRMPQSGGIEGFEGDVETVETLMECKETEIKEGGKKQITIKKEWHKRIENESKKKQKTPFLVYGFKKDGDFDDDDVFFSTRFKYLLNMLHYIKICNERVDELEKENEILRQKIKEFKQKGR